MEVGYYYEYSWKTWGRRQCVEYIVVVGEYGGGSPPLISISPSLYEPYSINCATANEPNITLPRDDD